MLIKSGKKTLKNIQAIRQMLDGTHRTQTKSQSGYTGKTTEVKRQVGEIWTETDIHGNDTTWEQKDGYKLQHGKLDSARDLMKSFQLPSVCPKCEREMKKNKYNQKMWGIHKMCFDCVIEMEHEHHMNGTFEEYAKSIIVPNVESWLKDAYTEVQELKTMLTTDMNFPNIDGSMERWEAPYKNKPSEIIDYLDSEFNKLKEMLCN